MGENSVFVIVVVLRHFELNRSFCQAYLFHAACACVPLCAKTTCSISPPSCYHITKVVALSIVVKHLIMMIVLCTQNGRNGRNSWSELMTSQHLFSVARL